MKPEAAAPFGVRLKALREAAGFTQEELASIAGLSVHAVSALERGQRRRPQVETLRALAAALDLSDDARTALMGATRDLKEIPAGHLPRSTALPLPPTELVGRSRDVETLLELLADSAARLVTLTGPGGVGKTRLALEVAHVIAEGSERVLFVPLSTAHTPALVASLVAEALGLPDVPPAELAARAHAACCDRATLLVLDNFEHVLEAAPLAADLLASVGSLRLLVTSRAPLHVRGEREYPVGPLSIEDGAVRLFVERVKDVQPEFQLTSENAAVVTAICRRLDALPLAIELAAPWIKVLTPAGLSRQLADDVLLSTAGPRDLPKRQQTINATVAWSYQLLAPEEQRAFRRFGAIQGPFSIEAASAVLSDGRVGSVTAGDALTAAVSLMDKSLLVRADSEVSPRPHFQMLETVRAYALLALTAAGERHVAFEGLARHCLRAAALAAQGLVGPAQVEWLNDLRHDLDTYRAVLRWLIDNERPSDAADIASGLTFYWLIRGHATEGLNWFDQIGSLPSLSPDAEAKVLVGAAIMSLTQGALPRAREAIDRAVQLSRDHGLTSLLVQAEHVGGHLARAMGRLDEARDLLTRSAESFKTLRMPWAAGSALNGLAGIVLASGDADRAERLLDDAASQLREAGPWFQMQVLFVRAIFAVRRGRADEAIAFVRENLSRIRELHDRFAFVYALVPLAAAAALNGDDEWAARILGVRDAVTDRTGARAVDATVRDLRETAERDASARLGPDRWERAYAAGRRTSIDSADDLYRFVFEGR